MYKTTIVRGGSTLYIRHRNLSVITDIQTAKQKAKRSKCLATSPKHKGLAKKLLIKLFVTKKNLAELRTALAVAQCRALIKANIENIFQEKELQLGSIVKRLLRHDSSFILSDSDLQRIYSAAENILTAELSNCFGRYYGTSPLKADISSFSHLWDALLAWQKTVEKTVFITAQAEFWSKRALCNVTNTYIPNNLLADLLNELDLNTALIHQMGLNANLEKSILASSLLRRTQGILHALKLRIIYDLEIQVANNFYTLHDELDALRAEKISALQQKAHQAEEFNFYLEA